MKIILINSKKHGEKKLLVDDDKLDMLNSLKFSLQKGRSTFYATYSKSGKQLSLHRFLLDLKPSDKKVCDHRDGNGLNNQISNLRVSDYKQNGSNRLSAKNSSSKFLGVCWCKDKLKWRASITTNKKNIKLGYFINEIDAAKAYNSKANEVHGEFANLNIITL